MFRYYCTDCNLEFTEKKSLLRHQVIRHKSCSMSEISSISSRSKIIDFIDNQDTTLTMTPATSTSAQCTPSQIPRHKSSSKSKISSISPISKINEPIDDQDTTLNATPATSTSAEHTQIRIKCNVCDKTFRWESRLKEHKIAMHSPKSPIKDKVKCGICDAMLLPGRMKMHIAHVHSKL